MVLAQKTFSVRKNIHGKDGTPALTLAVIPSQLVFDTDESGAILTKVLSANTAKVGLYDGQTEVTAEKYDVTPVNCTATLANGVLTITSVTNGAYSGRVDITATYKGKTRVGSVAFNVNANHVYKGKFDAQEKAIEAIISDTAVKEDGSLLSKAYSMFKMLSDKIRLFVTDGLKRAGIEITTRGVTIVGDKLSVRNSAGHETAAFDEYGNLRAGSLQTSNDKGVYTNVHACKWEIGYNNKVVLDAAVTEEGIPVIRYFVEGRLIGMIDPALFGKKTQDVPNSFKETKFIFIEKSVYNSTLKRWRYPSYFAVRSVMNLNLNTYYQFSEGYTQKVMESKPTYKVSGTSVPSEFDQATFKSQFHSVQNYIDDGFYCLPQKRPMRPPFSMNDDSGLTYYIIYRYEKGKFAESVLICSDNVVRHDDDFYQ